MHRNNAWRSRSTGQWQFIDDLYHEDNRFVIERGMTRQVGIDVFKDAHPVNHSLVQRYLIRLGRQIDVGRPRLEITQGRPQHPDLLQATTTADNVAAVAVTRGISLAGIFAALR